VELAVLRELLARRDELVRAITRGVAEQDWDAVMEALDGLLAALKQLELSLERVPPGRRGRERTA
jgi:hypothetical protein